jgi:N-formylmaleamate deformylase
VLVGHSLGARIAAAFDVLHSGRAAGLVLVDPPLSGPGREPYPFPLTMYSRMFEIVTSSDDPVAELGEVEPGTSVDRLVERVRWLRVTDENAVRETYRGFHTESCHAFHIGLSAPAVLIRGAESPVVTATHAAELKTLRPDIPIVTIADAGHLVPQDNPDAFCDSVFAFAGRLFE